MVGTLGAPGLAVAYVLSFYPLYALLGPDVFEIGVIAVPAAADRALLAARQVTPSAGG